MGDKKSPDVWKVSPPQHLTVCLTMRDRFGMPLVGVRVRATQAGTDLKTEAGHESTDKAGRIFFNDVSSGPITITIPDDTIPLDQKDVRAGKPQQYKYAPIGPVEPVQIQALQTGDALPFIEQTRAYATVYCDVTPWTPRYRFPWQNPIHREAGGIYAKREIALRNILIQLGVADASAMAHDDLVKKLVERYEAHAVFGGGVVPPSDPVAPSTGGAPGATGAEHETEQPPAAQSAPEHAKAVSTGTKIDVAPTAPHASPPALPPVQSSPGALPGWVWYMLFHYAGIRYKSAHGSYIDPSQLLELLRKDQIDSAWPSKTPGEPAPVDVTEAFALTASATTRAAFGISEKDAHGYQADLAASKAATVVNALRKLHRVVAERARAHVSGRVDIRRGLNGDHHALGFLTGMKLLSSLGEGDVKALEALTAWRNDVTKEDGELPTGLAGAFTGTVRKGLATFAADSWKRRAFTTLDLLTTSVVCNQASELAEHARGYEHIQLIGGNAASASKTAPLFPLTKANWGRVQRGMHLFFYGYRAPKKEDQPYPNGVVTAEGWMVARGPAPGAAVALESLPRLPANHTYASLVDPAHPLNVYERKHPKDDSENANLMERADLDGIYTVDAKVFTGFEYGEYPSVTEWTAVVQIGVANVQDLDETGALRFQVDPADPKGKKKVPVYREMRRVGLLKWTHEEVVVDVRKDAVYTFSTAAPKAVGVKSFPGRDYPSILVGAANPIEQQRQELPFYLRTDLLAGAAP